MFNKFAKSIRWIVLAGMLYSLYVVMIKDSVEFDNQTDEVTLVKMAKEANKSRDTFKINQRLLELYPNKKEHQVSYMTSVKQQANKLIDAHEKMLYPVAIGNYRYVRNIKFALDKDKKFILLFQMTEIFYEDVDEKTRKTLSKMLHVTHEGMYQHFGFENVKLLLVPSIEAEKSLWIINLQRKNKELPQPGSYLTPKAVNK